MVNKENMSIVSVIMPVFNGAKCCKRAIESVLHQTYQQIELIVVNDGSTDGTEDIVQEIAAVDDRLKLISQANAGVSSARNRGIKESSGEYIAFIDADDYMNNTFVEKMLHAMLQEQTDVASCGYTYVYSDGRRTEKTVPVGDRTIDTIEQYVSTNVINLLWNKLYKKALISHLFNTDRSMGEDLEFNTWYFTKVGSISTIFEPLYEYTYDSEGSLTKKADLVWNSIVDDWNCLFKLCFIGIKKETINAKMFDRLLDILKKQNRPGGVKNLLEKIESNSELKELIEKSSFNKIKYKMAQKLIKKESAGMLFLFFSLKQWLKKILHM
ncbi:glycosyltransferase family 2 protein [Butyrivibrio sp. AE2032]|uniref:glycosyltransferase family 2 protein n=1 Tax=Butyrivibrio sp. AE2032 TaxID=1458463 RepID=UPI00068C343E|nr:glycosyltransferase [Butyrivibrio sp. AE2032]